MENYNKYDIDIIIIQNGTFRLLKKTGHCISCLSILVYFQIQNKNKNIFTKNIDQCGPIKNNIQIEQNTYQRTRHEKETTLSTCFRKTCYYTRNVHFFR